MYLSQTELFIVLAVVAVLVWISYKKYDARQKLERDLRDLQSSLNYYKQEFAYLSSHFPDPVPVPDVEKFVGQALAATYFHSKFPCHEGYSDTASSKILIKSCEMQAVKVYVHVQLSGFTFVDAYMQRIRPTNSLAITDLELQEVHATILGVMASENPDWLADPARTARLLSDEALRKELRI